MEKKSLYFISAIALGVFVGATLAVQKVKNEPATTASITSTQRQMSELIKTQRNIQQILTKMEKNQQIIVKFYQQAAAGFQGLQRQAKGSPQQAPPSEDLNKVHSIPVDHSYVRGAKDAPVTIVEFVDFQCPFCSKFHPPVTQAINAYPGKVNYIIKNFPLAFHQQAKSAAKAAMAAGEQGKYYEMADLLLDNSRSLNEDKYKELAGQLGLNVEKFLKDYKEKDSQYEDMIAKDMKLGEQVAVRGTPTFYINGRKTNARDLDSFKAEIDQILSN